MGQIRTEMERPDLVRLDVDGEIDAAEMTAGLDAFLAAVEPLERFDVLYLVRDLHVPTAGAIRVELSRIGRLWKLLPRIGKVALVADQGWVRAAAKAEGVIFRGLDIRTFEADEEAEARAWLGV